MDKPRENSTTPPIAPFDSPAHVYAPDECELTSEAVVSAVAAATDTDPLSLPPLYEAVDPDALDALFDRETGTEQRDLVITFPFASYEVVVDAGTVLLVE